MVSSEALKGAAAEILNGAAPPAGIALGVHSARGCSVAIAGARDERGNELGERDWFDVASVTKVMATTALIMALVTRGSIRFDDQVIKYVPPPGVGGEEITIRDLLTHRSGLWEWQPFYLRADEPRDVYHEIERLPLRYPIGAARHYSDLGFMLLGRIIEVVTSMPLAMAFDSLVARPLNVEAGFSPAGRGHTFVTSARGDGMEERMLATGQPYPILFEENFSAWRREPVAGHVNDGNAYRCFNGVAGHAGLFATIRGLLDFATVLTERNRWEKVFSESVMREVFTECRDDTQALGFRRDFRQFQGEKVTVYWHPGFTGCALGAIPDLGIAAAMGSNRLLAPGEPTPTQDLWNVLLTSIGLVVEGGVR